MTDKISITFDEENRIRVLEQEKYKETDTLKNESMEFIKKVLNLDEIISQIAETLDTFSKKIELQKLRAIGERNKVESEADNRKKKMLDLNNLLNERKAELERYTTELDSLAKAEAE